MNRPRAGGLAAALMSMLATTQPPGAPAAPILEPAPDRLPPARPALELVPPHDVSEPQGSHRIGSLAQDREFALNMRQHYQYGLDQANLQMTHGRSTRLKALALRVAEAESLELAALEKWIARQTLRITRANRSP